MEKLDKVIAGLTGCVACICSNCEYTSDDGCGRDDLMIDALELLKELRSDNERLDKRWTAARNDLIDEQMRSRDFERKALVTRAERDTARREVLRLEAKLFKLGYEATGMPGPQTNYRKIKNMGPLYFADWIMRTLAPCECCDKHGVCGIPQNEVNDEYCAEHILAWLMQEAENGKSE